MNDERTTRASAFGVERMDLVLAVLAAGLVASYPKGKERDDDHGRT
jgi:hypothetical protein